MIFANSKFATIPSCLDPCNNGSKAKDLTPHNTIIDNLRP